MSPVPTLRIERSMLREGVVHLACLDEVGRGALSGPVSVGAVVVCLETRTAPQGVRDSKLLTPDARERLAPRIRRWAVCHAVGHASPAEIDEIGIIAALRLAGRRALGALSVTPDAVLLDGNHDYLSPPAQPSLVELVETPPVGSSSPAELVETPPVKTIIKADMKCAGVAAASILAKTERDAMMVALHDEHPEYAWAENKGYSAPVHMEALARLGPSVHHRRSWALPGIGSLTAAHRSPDSVLDSRGEAALIPDFGGHPCTPPLKSAP